MKRFMLLGVVFSIWTTSCTKQNVFDSGISSPYFEGTILEYMRSNPENWELTVQLIEHAELEDLFDGRVDSLPEITFFAPPHLSILAYLYYTADYDGRWNEDYSVVTPYEISDLDKEWVRKTLLKYVVKGKVLRSDIAFINQDEPILEGVNVHPKQDGGTYLTTLGGCELFVYIWRHDWKGVPYAGAHEMFAFSQTFGQYLPLATPDIQPSNGVVHALTTGARLGDI